MNRRTRAWALLGVASCALACENGAAPADASGGSSGAATAGANPGTAGSGGAGGAGGATSTAGSAGQSAAGNATGGTGAGTGGESAGSGGVGGSAAGGGTAGAGGGGNPSLPKRVLLYHFNGEAIGADAVAAQLMLLKTQLMTWGYEVEDSVNPDDVSTTNLARFGGVGMINTCFEPFGKGKTGETQTAALKAFVENGGGLFGTHCASVTFQAAEPPNPYNSVIGGRGGHGFFDGKSACRTTEAHVTTMMLPATFDFTGNLDNADFLAEDSKVLVKCKWSGGDMKDTAVSWYRTPGKGRVFYTNFAKVAADISDATLGQKHILLGLGWTLGR